MADDHHNIKFKSLYIDMDLAMHRNSNSPRVRELQKSLDSHDEFQFNMSKMSIKDDLFEPVHEVASADKLLFRGQLLPLQHDPSLQRMQTMVCPKEESCDEKGAFLDWHYGDLMSFRFPNEGSQCNKHGSEKAFLMMSDDFEDSFPTQFSSTQARICHPIKHEGGFSPEFSLRDGIDLMRSCRLDGVFDSFKNDSRSSSFRSHQSSYWSSTEKDSRDSISSSRCSTGSNQDSCFQGAERKAPYISMLKANLAPNTESECTKGVFNDKADAFHSRNCGKSSIPTSNSRKWSWKGFVTGLRKASRLWVDDERGDKGQATSKGETKEMNKRPVFTFNELPGALGEPVSYRRSVGHDWEWQANTYQFVSNEGSVKKGRKPTEDYEDQQIGAIYCLRSGGRQEANGSSNGGNAGEGAKKDMKGKGQGNAWNAKESWNRCVSKVKKGTRLSTSSSCKLQHKELMAMESKNMSVMMMNEEDIYRVNMKAKSLSSTPVAKSPVRGADYNGISDVNGGLYFIQRGAGLASSSSSSKKNMNKKVGFASCPASMRSSPHHSGLLAVVNKATPDLHTAIQGAIAHCKQS
eukprot:c24372_g3_i3 orf=1-1728(-)